MLLSDAVDEYLAARKGSGVSTNTLRNLNSDLRRFLTAVGNIHTQNITQQHTDLALGAAALKLGPASMNNYQATLGKFFKWCRSRRYMHRDSDPMYGRTQWRVPRVERRRLNVTEFPTLLDSAEHPRDRVILALGLYLFLRSGEISTLRLSDVDLDAGEIRVVVHKSKDLDTMPICAELDTELRAWLTAYTRMVGPLSGDFYLTPARAWGHKLRDTNGRFLPDTGVDTLRPHRSITHMEDVVKRALHSIGFPIRDTGGVSTREGIHTLRRSGARALFDQLSGEGYDGALQEVKTWLHHKNATMTEHYLGLDAERRKRDIRAKGRLMFTPQQDAVTQLVVAR